MYIQFKDTFTWVGRFDIDDRIDTVSLTINGSYRLNLKYKMNEKTGFLFNKRDLITLIKANYKNNTVIDLNFMLEDIERPDIELYMENLQNTFITEESIKERIFNEGVDTVEVLNKTPIDVSTKSERSIDDLLGNSTEDKDYKEMKERVDNMEDPLLESVNIEMPESSGLAIDTDEFGLNSTYFDEEELSKISEEQDDKTNQAVSESFSKYEPPKPREEDRSEIERRPINDFLTRKMLEMSTKKSRKGNKVTGLGILRLLSRL